MIVTCPLPERFILLWFYSDLLPARYPIDNGQHALSANNMLLIDWYFGAGRLAASCACSRYDGTSIDGHSNVLFDVWGAETDRGSNTLVTGVLLSPIGHYPACIEGRGYHHRSASSRSRYGVWYHPLFGLTTPTRPPKNIEKITGTGIGVHHGEGLCDSSIVVLLARHHQLCRKIISTSTKYQQGLPAPAAEEHHATQHYGSDTMILIGIIDLQRNDQWPRIGLAALPHLPMAIAAFWRSFRRMAFGGI